MIASCTTARGPGPGLSAKAPPTALTAGDTGRIGTISGGRTDKTSVRSHQIVTAVAMGNRMVVRMVNLLITFAIRAAQLNERPARNSGGQPACFSVFVYGW